jgi:quinol-cytochrome oxidoreductase complex cytochrome b subunit
MLRVIIQGAYKKPREVTWLAGMGLLFITLGFGFTGYLLPWDQRAYWATTVGTEIAAAVPIIGDGLRDFLRGGPEVSALTLSRFLGVHMLILPAALIGLLAIHLLIIHQQGLADPKAKEDQ